MARLALMAPEPQPSPNIEVTNHLGVVVYTSNDASLARRWAKDNAPLLGDLVIDEVVVRVERKRVTTVRRKAPKLELVPAPKTENREVMV